MCIILYTLVLWVVDVFPLFMCQLVLSTAATVVTAYRRVGHYHISIEYDTCKWMETTLPLLPYDQESITKKKDRYYDSLIPQVTTLLTGATTWFLDLLMVLVELAGDQVPYG